MNLTIRQILDACKGTFVYHGIPGQEDAYKDICVSGVVLDSRQVAEGGVFVATVGQRVDGHSFIRQVFQRGVSLVVCEKAPEQLQEEPMTAEAEADLQTCGSYVLVKDSFQALKDIAEAYRKTLDIPVIGITGSVGKTSTKEFIAGVLGEKYQVLKTEGNYNNEVGVPLTLLRIRPEHQVAVVEMGISDFGEMHRLSQMVRPDIAVITNIGQCHLENLKTRDGILQAKTEIFDFMSESGHICLNGEDDKLQTVKPSKGRQLRFFGLGENPLEQVYATDIKSKGLWGSRAVLHHQTGNSYTVEIPLPGIHMVTNAAAAACVAEILGLSSEEIARGISHVSAIGGRNRLIAGRNWTLIDDCYNANPVSMQAGIDLLQMADTHRVALLGDMYELGEDSDRLHAGIGTYAIARGVDTLICVGENSRHMYEAALKAQDACVAKQEVVEPQKVIYFATRDQLLQQLQSAPEQILPAGSTVLIKASHGMHFEEIVELLK